MKSGYCLGFPIAVRPMVHTIVLQFLSPKSLDYKLPVGSQRLRCPTLISEGHFFLHVVSRGIRFCRVANVWGVSQRTSKVGSGKTGRKQNVGARNAAKRKVKKNRAEKSKRESGRRENISNLKDYSHITWPN
jgi:hypothetical protein